jgi:hypothetical protein
MRVVPVMTIAAVGVRSAVSIHVSVPGSTVAFEVSTAIRRPISVDVTLGVTAFVAFEQAFLAARCALAAFAPRAATTAATTATPAATTAPRAFATLTTRAGSATGAFNSWSRAARHFWRDATCIAAHCVSVYRTRR